MRLLHQLARVSLHGLLGGIWYPPHCLQCGVAERGRVDRKRPGQSEQRGRCCGCHAGSRHCRDFHLLVQALVVPRELMLKALLALGTGGTT